MQRFVAMWVLIVLAWGAPKAWALPALPTFPAFPFDLEKKLEGLEKTLGTRAGERVTVQVVHTARLQGLYSFGMALNEANPLFDSKVRGDLVAEGFELETASLRNGPWILYVPGEKYLPAQAARSLFDGPGIQLDPNPKPIPALISNFATVFQRPQDDSHWLVPWLETRLLQADKTPDVRSITATILSGKTAGGASVRILSEDGRVPPAEILRDSMAWRFSGGARMRVMRGQKASVLYLKGRRLGGLPLHELANRLRREHAALRVDVGNIVETPDGTFGEAVLEDLFEELPNWGLDLLVPYKNELKLASGVIRRLAAAVPLVAANLTAPPGIPLKPYLLREIKGVRLATIGLADTVVLRHHGLLGGRTGWSGEDPVRALRRTLGEVDLERPAAIIVVTNIAEERLPELRRECVGVAAVITRHMTRPGFQSTERVEIDNPQDIRRPRPWLVAGAESPHVGILGLDFRSAAPKPPGQGSAWQLVGVSHETQLAHDGMKYDRKRMWRMFELMSEYLDTRRWAILPDMRQLSARDRSLVFEDNDPLIVYRTEEWSRLTAAILRRATGAEVAAIHRLQSASTLVGEVPVPILDDWLPTDLQVAICHLTGAQIKRLSATDPDHEKLAFAGYDPAKGLIGGRPLVETEKYRLATFDAVALNEEFQELFHGGVQIDLRLEATRIEFGKSGQNVNSRDVVVATLKDLKHRHQGFTDGYLGELGTLLHDDGSRFEPRLSLALKPFEGSFQQAAVSNREAFGEVRNSRVNTPSNTTIRGKGNVALIYETPELDWENRAAVDFQRLELQFPDKSVVQEPRDDVDLTSEFRLRVFKLQAPGAALDFVPFVNGNYLTEFTPTEDPKTNAPNPRRHEVSGILGIVLYPGTWFKEFRLGAIVKNDIAAKTGGFEPGMQLAALLEQRLGPAVLSLDNDLKYYVRTAEDTPNDLGLLGQFGGGIRFPILGGLSVRFGIDALVFTGKVGASPPVGYNITPTVGLSYNATWKPQVGIVY